MHVHGKAVSAALGCLLIALLGFAGATQGFAQSPQQPDPGAALPSLPDGFVVTPPRQIIPLPRFEFDYRAPSSGTLEGDSGSNSQAPGCRYEERKLELLV